jgi:RNA 3'-terminal phosphate cyclase (ATP)
VRAATEVAGAEVEGATIGATSLTFAPRRVRGGRYRFTVGTAGSACLVLQTVLPALLTADRPSDVEIEGGTHNPLAPTYDFLARTYLPSIERMGPRVVLSLARHGFEPAGGGRLHARIEPVPQLKPFDIAQRGALERLEAEILVSHLPQHIAQREARALAALLDMAPESIASRSVADSAGPGNVVTVYAVAAALTETFVAFGRRGVPAERVAESVAHEVREHLASGAPVGKHLADQLLLPLALAGGGGFTTLPPSQHTLTNLRVIQAFLPLPIRCEPLAGTGHWRVEVEGTDNARA